MFVEVVVSGLCWKASVRELFGLEKVERFLASPVFDETRFGHDFQSEENVVVPLGWIVKFDEDVVDYSAVSLSSVHSSLQEDLGSFLGGQAGSVTLAGQSVQ